MSNPWIFHREGTDIHASDYAYLANGYIGLRVPPWGNSAGTDEARGLIAGLHSIKDTVMSNQEKGIPPPSPIRLPIFDRLDLTDAQGRSLILPREDANVSQTLDIRHGELHTRIEHEDAIIEQLCFCNQQHRHLVQQHLVLRARKNLQLTIDGEIDTRTSKGFVQAPEPVETTQDGIILRGRTELHGVEVAIRVELIVCGGEETITSASRKLVREVKVTEGESIEIWKCAILADDRHAHDSVAQVRMLFDPKQLDAYTQAHRDAWEERWNNRVEVDNPQWNRLISMAQYNLKASHDPRNPWGLPAMGLSSYAWDSYVFPWDAALWMFPYFLMTEPEAARQMLEFDINGMMGERTRLEYYAAGDTIKMYDPGCVAWAAWQYYLVTRNRAWLAERGSLIFEAACKGYHRRSVFNDDLGKFEIRGVWPADEFATQDSDNNVFTNAIAERVLGIYQRVCELLGHDFPDAYKPMLEHGFWLPFDHENQRHIEHARWRDGKMADAYDGAEIKQADVNLIRFPLEWPLPEEVVRNDLEYYIERMTYDGPEMTWGVFSVIAAELKDDPLMMRCLEHILAFFRTSFEIFRETPENTNTVFMTGSADLLQAFMFGCCGIRLREDEIFTQPFVPASLGECRFYGVHMAGKCYDMIVEGDRLLKMEAHPSAENIKS